MSKRVPATIWWRRRGSAIRRRAGALLPAVGDPSTLHLARAARRRNSACRCARLTCSSSQRLTTRVDMGLTQSKVHGAHKMIRRRRHRLATRRAGVDGLAATRQAHSDAPVQISIASRRLAQRRRLQILRFARRRCSPASPHDPTAFLLRCDRPVGFRHQVQLRITGTDVSARTRRGPASALLFRPRVFRLAFCPLPRVKHVGHREAIRVARGEARVAR